MLIAQALGEYGSMSSVMTAVSDGFNRLEDTIRRTDTPTWVLLVIGGAILWMIMSGRRR